jgi:hypothetical protein
MNALERLLQDDMNRLIDRIAVTAHEGLVGACEERRPDLLSQLADVETRLTAARRRLLCEYTKWLETLDESADLWALADLAAAPTVAGERRAA